MTKSFIEFELVEKKPKTNVYNVISTSRGDLLGQIYWYPQWRQYIFEPNDDTIWNRICLREVITFLQNLMDKHYNKIYN